MMRTFFRDYMTPTLVMILIGVVTFDHLNPDRGAGPHPSATVDGVKLGRAYAQTLAPALADGWEAAAGAIEAGKSVTEAQEALQTTFKAARVKAFTEKVAPDFARILPEGVEPRDAAARAEVATLWRGFARGLKGGR